MFHNIVSGSLDITSNLEQQGGSGGTRVQTQQVRAHAVRRVDTSRHLAEELVVAEADPETPNMLGVGLGKQSLIEELDPAGKVGCVCDGRDRTWRKDGKGRRHRHP